jgi:integrase
MAARRRGRTPTVLPDQYAAILNEYAIALRRADMTVEGFRALRPSPRTSSATASVPTSSRSGIDLVTVAELLGHVSLDSTRIYTLPTDDDLDAAVALLTVDR